MILHKTLIERLPKVELHLHIEGSLEPEMMFELAQRNGVKLPYDSVEAVRAAYNFDCLQSFLDLYYNGMGVLQKHQDFFDLTFAYFKRAHADNVRHAEIFFDPQGHTDRGVAFDTCVGGIWDGMQAANKEFGITSLLIPSFLRHLSEEAAFATLEQMRPHMDKFVAVGLDSSEVGHPPSKFQRVFDAVREAGLRVVAHAGEEGPPSYVEEALDLLKVQRIDHGVRSLEKPELVARLVASQMPLTVCPLSNLRLCVVKDLKDHNLRQLLDVGLCATVNSDDPAYFGGYMTDNYWQCVQALGLQGHHVAALARNGINASFASGDRKVEMHRELAAVLNEATA